MALAYHATGVQNGERDLPLTSNDEKFTLIGTVRLNNRESLIKRLRLRNSNVPTDGEIVLAAFQRWGVDCFNELYGDFSLVIWDRVHRRMVLGRDCFGVRGLYIYRDENWIAVSDEVGNLLKMPFANTPKIGSKPSVAKTNGSYTPWKNITRIPPAHFGILESSLQESKGYWRPHLSPSKAGTLEEWSDHIQTSFEKAVSRALNTERQVGAHISGGLDSSLVSIVADRQLKRKDRSLKLFSACPPPDGTTLAEDDERRYINLVVSRSGLGEVHYCPINPTPPEERQRSTGWENRFEESILKTALDLGVEVMLTGLGGDETLTHNGFGSLPQLFQERDWRALRSVAGVKYLSKRLWLEWKRSILARRSTILSPFRVRVLTKGALSHRMEQFDFVQNTDPVEYRHPFLDRLFVEDCLRIPLIFVHGQKLWKEAMGSFFPTEYPRRRLKLDRARMGPVLSVIRRKE